jgi:hypothetical protein
LSRWAVHLIECPEVVDPPNKKYVAIAYQYPTAFLGLYINTMIPHIHRGTDSERCYAMIRLSEHSFLKYDSWVSATDADEFEYTRISAATYKGCLSPSAVRDALKAVEECDLIKVGAQTRILTPDW